MNELLEKWNRRYRDASVEAAAPARVLVENRHLLPAQGQALEIACGLGANARLLAEHGLQTLAWDIASVAVAKLNAFAQREHLPLQAEVHDVELAPPEPESVDVIVVSHFLTRELAPPLVNALRRGGLLFYQTFIQESVDDTGPGNPAFRLEANELLRLFAPLRILVYREEGRVGDVAQGFRNEAMLVGCKAPSDKPQASSD